MLDLKREKITTVDWELKDVMLEDNLTELNKTTKKLRQDNQELQQKVDTLEEKVKNCNKTDSSGALTSTMNFDLIPIIVPYLFFILNFLT